ncbi:MAG: ABC transporter permease [Micropruina sp.]|nr:ABC transporter permease [Micropruina sp.]
MTSQSAFLDSNRLVYSGAAPSPSEQARRARRWGWLIYAECRLRRMKAYFGTILVVALLYPVLYLAAMGIGLGSLVNSGVGGIDGVPYLVFVGAGLLVSTIVTESTNEFTFSIMAGFKWEKTFYATQASPISPAQMVIGEVVGVFVRLFAQAIPFWVALLVFGAAPSGWSWLIVPIAAVAGISFGAPLMAYSATVEDEGYQFAFVQRFIVMPMFLFAGTFYPLAQMPPYLQWVGWISPMWHGTQLGRIVSYGMENPLWLTVVHVLALVIPIVVGVALSVRVFTARLMK